jgi:hypothetical protein
MAGYFISAESWIAMQLRAAIEHRRCLEIEVGGTRRAVCPHALGFRDGARRVLVYQFAGASASGLARGGAWRSFTLSEIAAIHPIAGSWQTQHDYIAKAETSFDRIECQARPGPSAALRKAVPPKAGR